MDAPLNTNDYWGIKKYEGHGKDLIAPEYGYHYMSANPNSCSNAVVKIIEYHIDKLTIFQDIIDASGPEKKWWRLDKRSN